MASVTIRIPREAHERAQRLATAQERPLAQVVAEALARYEREEMIAGYWADLDRVYADPVAAAEEQADSDLWDAVSLYDLNQALAEEETSQEGE